MHKKSESNNKIVGVDFFCGVGGMTHGLSRAGIDMLGGLDNDIKCKAAYELNNKSAKFIAADISNLAENKKLVLKVLNQKKYSHSIFAACAPCQPFSTQNKKYLDDRRKSLMLNFIELIEILPKNKMPSAILIENVGPMKVRGKEILDEILIKLKNIGYNVLQPKVHNAANYSVPQNRKRLIFIAIKSKLINRDKFNWKYFEKVYKSDKIIDVKSAFGKNKLKEIEAGETAANDSLQTARKLSKINLERIKAITVPGGSRDMWPEHLRLKCHENYKGHSDVYGRMAWNKPAPTLTTKCNSISNGRFGHPEQNRALSLREAAILQTMEDYNFQVPIIIDDVARQIGNAVPPKLAKKFGYFIKEILD